MIPSRRLLLLTALLAIPMLLAGINRSLTDVALIANLLLLVLAFLDLLISPAPTDITIHRELAQVPSVGAANPSKLVGRHPSPPTLPLIPL